MFRFEYQNSYTGFINDEKNEIVIMFYIEKDKVLFYETC